MDSVENTTRTSKTPSQASAVKEHEVQCLESIMKDYDNRSNAWLETKPRNLLLGLVSAPPPPPSDTVQTLQCLSQSIPG